MNGVCVGMENGVLFTVGLGRAVIREEAAGHEGGPRVPEDGEDGGHLSPEEHAREAEIERHPVGPIGASAGDEGGGGRAQLRDGLADRLLHPHKRLMDTLHSIGVPEVEVVRDRLVHPSAIVHPHEP